MPGNNINLVNDPAATLQADLKALAPAISKLVTYYQQSGGAPDLAVNAASSNLADAQQQATTLQPTYRAWQEMQALLPLLPNFSFDPSSGNQPAPFQTALGVFALAVPQGWTWGKTQSVDAPVGTRPVAFLGNYIVFQAVSTGKATINGLVVDSNKNVSNVTLQVTVYDPRSVGGQACPPCGAIVGSTAPTPTTAPAGYVSNGTAWGAGVGGLLLGAIGGLLLSGRKQPVPTAHENQYARR